MEMRQIIVALLATLNAAAGSVQEFKIEVCAEEDVRRNTLLEEYQACLDAQSAAESAREQRCESFLQPLMAAAAAVRRRVLDVQLVVQHEMLLNPSTDVEEAKARNFMFTVQHAMLHCIFCQKILLELLFIVDKAGVKRHVWLAVVF